MQRGVQGNDHCSLPACYYHCSLPALLACCYGANPCAVACILCFHRQICNNRTVLPIHQIREEFSAAAQKPGCCLLLSAPTGSGKSTCIPRFLAEEEWTQSGLILVVQPRRLAARMLASYVAKQWPCKLGDEVGFAVRFESRSSAKTRVLFVTDGMLERRLMGDQNLKGVSVIIFDEVHERRLSGDLCLARAMQLQAGARPDLGIVVMSATLQVDKLEQYLPQAKVLRAEGRLYPVDISYRAILPQRDRRGVMVLPPLWDSVVAGVRTLVEQMGNESGAGDILAFLPGAYEIRRAEEMLSSFGWMRGRDVFALHGQLSPELQHAAVELGKRPRVILSTNIAETSLTIEGVRAVVDSGCARESRWDSNRGISTLHITPISQAQADQRAGRAGRLGPGHCLRLWTESEHRRRAAFPSPELLRADLSAALLNLLAWDCASLEDIRRFPWLDAPSEKELQRAWHLLANLGALNLLAEGADEDAISQAAAPSINGEPEAIRLPLADGLSDIGRRMLRFALPPSLARLMIAGQDEGCIEEMAAIAALLGGESIALKSGLHERFFEEGDFTDFQAEWRALSAAIAARFDPSACGSMGIMGRAARELSATYRQLCPRAGQANFILHRKAIIRALLHAMPLHLAVRHGQASLTARLTGKRSAKVSQPSLAAQADCTLFLAAEITEIGGKSVETRLSRATLISLEDIETKQQDVALYDSIRKRVLNYRQLMYRDLLISQQEQGNPSRDEAAALLAEQVMRGKIMLKSWDGHVLQWINRLRCLREAMPELEMPDFNDDDKLIALTMLCDGAVSYKEVEARPVLSILREWLSGWQRDCLAKYAPKSLKLSNGREVKLLYREDGTPSFGMKCQFLFGVKETPCVADGRVTCLLEILSPNKRPYQVTRDLASFWARGYPQMKKDIAGRYPRHDWPDKAPDAP